MKKIRGRRIHNVHRGTRGTHPGNGGPNKVWEAFCVTGKRVARAKKKDVAQGKLDLHMETCDFA